MSIASCKAALCCRKLMVTLELIESLNDNGDLSDEDLWDLAEIAERADHKLSDLLVKPDD